MSISKDNVPKQKVVTFYLFCMKRDETAFQGRDFFIFLYQSSFTIAKGCPYKKGCNSDIFSKHMQTLIRKNKQAEGARKY